MENKENKANAFADEEYVLNYTGEETDALLKHTEGLKNQSTADDGDTVQVYDVNGIPHKISKTELLNKSVEATVPLEEISKFVAVDKNGNAVGTMTTEQVAEVFRKEFAKQFPSLEKISAFATVNETGDGLGLTSKEKAAEVLGELIGRATNNKDGLMPKEFTAYNINQFTPLDFNQLRDIFRPYGSYRGQNTPLGGGYYWGIYNIGTDRNHFVQIACASLDTEFIGIYARTYSGNSEWQGWKKVAFI